MSGDFHINVFCFYVSYQIGFYTGLRLQVKWDRLDWVDLFTRLNNLNTGIHPMSLVRLLVSNRRESTLESHLLGYFLL